MTPEYTRADGNKTLLLGVALFAFPVFAQPARLTTLTSFVSRVTTPGHPDFVAASDRIAVFDNDGTLWAEQVPRHSGSGGNAGGVRSKR